MKYNNNDILLYSVRKDNKIVVIYNDEEQMEKYLSSGNSKEAPIKVFNYSNELERELLSEMKKIANIETMPNSNIKITYKDGTEYVFAESNRETIYKIKNAQDNLTKEKIIGDFAKLPEEEKAKKKANISKNARAGLAGALATIILAGSIHYGAKIANNTSSDKTNDSKPSVEDTVEPTATPNPTATPIAENMITNEEIQKYADSLYNDVNKSDTYLLKLQQITGVTIDKNLSYSIVELINGIYPTRLVAMNDQQADEEMLKIREAIELIHASDFNNTNSADNMINLADYIKNEADKKLVTDTLYVAREVVSESIGEPLEGTILEDYRTKHTFSKEYINAVDQLINYEWETMNSTDFLQAPIGVKTVVTSIWFQMGAQIPTWSYVERESSEYEPRAHRLYFNYFHDRERNFDYLPRQGENGMCEYILTDEYCHEEKYTEAEMYALAGLPFESRDVEKNLKENPNIVQMGLWTEMKNRINEQDNMLYHNYEELVKTR